MSGAPAPSTVRLLAVALADETTWWLGEPRSAKVLSDNPSWSICRCNWLYPVDTSPESFADVPGFRPTSSIYEVGHDGYSNVYRTAVLADDVEATKVTINRVSYVFLPQEQAKRIDLIYKAMLRRESAATSTVAGEKNTATTPASVNAESPELQEPQEKDTTSNRVTAMRDDRVKAWFDEADALNALPSGARRPSDVADLKSLGVDQTDSLLPKHSSSELERRDDSLSSRAFKRETSVSSSMSYDTAASRQLRSHRRRRPLEGTTVIVAPHLRSPQGDHASNEAFAWPKLFIAHVGSADYLCPAATNNRYGFRLDKVSNTGFPVFLLFGSSVNCSYSFSPPVNAVPVYESTVLNGQGGSASGDERRVLVCTRLSGKVRSSQKSGDARTSHLEPVRANSADFEDIAEEETNDRQEDDDQLSHTTISEHTSRKRRRETNIQDHSSSHHRQGERHHHGAGDRRTKHGEVVTAATTPAADSLAAISVNLWSEPLVAVPPVAQLAADHPFSTQHIDAMHTTVFPDGTCVTYSAAMASKYATHTKKSSSSSGATYGSGAIDDDMKGLLENIELARLQSHGGVV